MFFRRANGFTSFIEDWTMTMTYGARNKIKGKVIDVKSDAIMSQVKFETASGEMSSVLTTESVEDMNLRVGDSVELVIKAIHVLPVKHT